MDTTSERERVVHLTNTEPGHNKQYIIKIEAGEEPGMWRQTSLYGPLGGNLAVGTGMKSVGKFDAALKALERLVNEKKRKGYVVESDSWADESATPAPVLQEVTEREDTGLRPMLLDEPDTDVEVYLTDERYWLQPKRDGTRTFVIRDGDKIVGAQRHGLTKALPLSVVEAALRVNASQFVLDGELVGETLVVFDVLERAGESWRDVPYVKRLAASHAMIKDVGAGMELIRTFGGEKQKRAAYALYRAENAEGVVFKLAQGKYAAGNKNGNVKFKFWKTASCIVMKLNEKASVQVGLLNDMGELVDVGGISINGAGEVYAVGDIVEVKYLYVIAEGGKLYQAGILRKRDDVQREDCTLAKQLMYRGAA